jgi:hypothetical protein
MEDDIRIYLREVQWEILDWIHVVPYWDQWRSLVNTVMNHRIP